MRPQFYQSTTSTAPPPPAALGDGLRRWNSPLPYLFGALALMMGVIAVALILLACSYKRSSSDQSSSGEKSERPVHALQPEMEPRVVVIMAGEIYPSHLAKPTALVRSSEEA